MQAWRYSVLSRSRRCRTASSAVPAMRLVRTARTLPFRTCYLSRNLGRSSLSPPEIPADAAPWVRSGPSELPYSGAALLPMPVHSVDQSGSPLLGTLLSLVGCAGVQALEVPVSNDATNADVETGDLKAHVSILAADSVEGRLTGIAGDVQVTNYLNAEFCPLGLEPVGSDKAISTTELVPPMVKQRRSCSAQSKRRHAMVLALSALVCVSATGRAQETGSSLATDVVERGAFRLYKLQQPVGREEYEVRHDDPKLVLTATSTLEFLGGGVPLSATLRMDRDFSPDSFKVRGRTSTLTDTDNSVVIKGRYATVGRRGHMQEVSVAGRFFTIGHYGPVSLEQALFRYWRRHGRPDHLALLPVGQVGFEHRGRDTVAKDGVNVILDRYSVRGLGWGRKSMWFNAAGDLIASVGGDAELDRFEAIREGFEAAIPVLVAGAIRDGLADLARVAATVKPVHQGTFAIAGARLVDGTGRPPVPDAVVLIRDGRIVAAGPRSSIRIPGGIPVVDGRGKTLLPGLWDMHAHYEQVEWPAAALAAGITTVRDAANEFELVTALRDAIHQGRALGPRMLLAGVIDGGEHPLGVVTANSPEEAREAVNRYKAAGFQQIKIYQSVRPELVSVIAAEAHRLGITVTGHVPTGMDVVQFV